MKSRTDKHVPNIRFRKSSWYHPGIHAGKEYRFWLGMISDFLKLFHHSFSMTLSIFHYTFNYSIHYYESRRERLIALLTFRTMIVHKSAICRFNGVKFETIIISQLLIDFFSRVLTALILALFIFKNNYSR